MGVESGYLLYTAVRSTQKVPGDLTEGGVFRGQSVHILCDAVSHDYVNAEGVRRAFDEFFVGRPEPVVELTSSQCLVMKLAAV